MSRLSRCLTFFTTFFALIHPGYGATFQGLGDLGGRDFDSRASAISVVVGRSSSASTTRVEAFRWTSSDGMVGLGFLAGSKLESFAYDVSGDGTVVVGESFSPSGDEAFRWTSDDGMVALGDLEDGNFDSRVNDVSTDGSVLVGQGHSNSGGEAMRWTSGSGMVGLGDLPGTGFDSIANGVSGDGSVVVGSSSSTFGSEAFRWISADGMVGLGDLAGGRFESSASAISADGSVVVGRGNSTSGLEAFRWTSGGGMVGLGDLAGGRFESSATAISADGSVVVGRSSSASSLEAFIWDSTNGMQELDEVLAGLGIDLTGWRLEEATGISADGLTIVGWGSHQSGTEAWIATIPETIFIPSGDYDGDNMVTVFDLNLVLFNWTVDGSEIIGPWTNERPADGTIVDDRYLNAVLFNWGSTVLPTTVPEPAGPTVLVLFVFLSLMIRKMAVE